MGWPDLVAQSAAIEKSECADEGVRFGGASGLGRRNSQHLEHMLVDGAKLKAVVGNHRDRRRDCDCVHFLLRRGDVVDLALVELKGGKHISVSELKEKFEHSEEDARLHARNAGCEELGRVWRGLPPIRRGSDLDRRRADFVKAIAGLRFATDLDDLIGGRQ